MEITNDEIIKRYNINRITLWKWSKFKTFPTSKYSMRKIKKSTYACKVYDIDEIAKWFKDNTILVTRRELKSRGDKSIDITKR